MRRAALLLLAAACSKPAPSAPASSPARPAPAVVSKCNDSTWGGWDGTPECKERGARPIPGADRTCTTDADCVKLAGGNCDDNIVNTAAAPRYADWPGPCNDPAAGDCSPSHAICASGCCMSWAR
jgi:hypothetical protein